MRKSLLLVGLAVALFGCGGSGTSSSSGTGGGTGGTGTLQFHGAWDLGFLQQQVGPDTQSGYMTVTLTTSTGDMIGTFHNVYENRDGVVTGSYTNDQPPRYRVNFDYAGGRIYQFISAAPSITATEIHLPGTSTVNQNTYTGTIDLTVQ